MAKAQIIITKTYGGQEGTRVKPGKTFMVNSSGDNDTVTSQRADQLKKRGLAEDYDPQIHGQENLRRPQAKVEPDSAPPSASKLAQRQQSRKRTNPDAPTEPERLASSKDANGQSLTGGQTGQATPPSLSREAPALSNATLRQRGNRAQGSSPSTPATESPPSQTSSTPVTPHGGDSTTPPSHSTEVID